MPGKKKARRRFGKIRRCQPSGRYQASYLDPEGVRRYGPHTFETKAEAADWLTTKEAELIRGTWTDPDRGKIPFGQYAETWIRERHGLRPQTVQLYTWLYRKYLEPPLGNVFLSDIDTARVRRWRHGLVSSGVSDTMAAKAYRLMRAILMTAVDDELIDRNPCRIRGAGNESPAERPVLTVEQVYMLADEMPTRLRALILVATFASLRFGEVSALQRRDLDITRGKVKIRRAFGEVRGKGLVAGPPKSRAGIRTVALPAAVIPDLKDHLASYVTDRPEALVFTGPNGAALRRGNFNKLVKWVDAVAKIGASGLHFHDLRHTGNTLAAATGASTRDLMARMGHDSINAAIIYQHATNEAGQAIASALDAVLTTQRNTGDRGDEDDDDPDDGAAGALVRAW